MTRWKLLIEYDGTAFSGWQKQARDVSVQQVLEEAFHKFSGEAAELFVAGRTDAGVHATGQVAHVDLQKETTADVIREAVNFHARPHPVALIAVEDVAPDFHARFDATRRSYEYRVLNRRAPSPLLAHRAWHIERPLSLELMREAAALLIGHHDFSTFRASHCQAASPVKTLDYLDVRAEEQDFFIKTHSRSFLYHQVRNMVGSLVFVGTGRWSVQDFAEAFEACDRRRGGVMAPPQGLSLVGVSYVDPSDLET